MLNAKGSMGLADRQLGRWAWRWGWLAVGMGLALAHQPRFLGGGGPVKVENPTVSQAFYAKLAARQSQTYKLPVLSRSIPIGVLVSDDGVGRSLQLQGELHCGESVSSLNLVDRPFYESFTRMHLRYRLETELGPTSEACELILSERLGKPASYILSVGDEERFGLGDVLELFNLGERLRRWKEGP